MYKRSYNDQGRGKPRPRFERGRDSVRPLDSLPQRATIPTEVPLSLSTVAENPCPSHDRIAVRAYQLWEANGKMTGTDIADWFEAERLVRVEPHQNR